MLNNMDQAGMETVSTSRSKLVTLARIQLIILIAVYIVPHLLGIEFLRKVPGVSVLKAAMPWMSAGTIFYIMLNIVGIFVGAYGFKMLSWSLLGFGFGMVVFNLVVLAISSVWLALMGAWHLLAAIFYILTEGGFKEMTHFHTAEMLFSAAALAISYFLVKLALKALGHSFQGVLIVGRAQEIENGVMNFLASFEGKTREEIMFLLMKNSLAKCLAVSLVGHFVAITVFSVPQFIQSVNEKIAEIGDTTEQSVEKQPAVKKEGEEGKEGEGEKGTGEGEPEPDLEFDTKAATKIKDSTGDAEEEFEDLETEPTGKAKDYEKHVPSKPKDKAAGDPDFGDLEPGDL